MRTLELVAYKRQDLGKKTAQKLRAEGLVPCVLYGGKENVHFAVPMILFRDLAYTPEVAQVNLNVEGTEYQCILQDLQFHPVSEIITHADFLELNEDKEVKMDVPVKFVGNSPGVQKGGKLVTKLRKAKVRALPKDMPEAIQVDISKLELGKSVKVSEIKAENFTILNNPLVTVATVSIPRALKSAQAQAAE
ncbi:50S ribosomal protein L25/general stress protein Ctc [Rapidithrix thailandica]|uniref:Large ribosomal subunit protein bL25 n=1 Tax=Rapidithrix thailandica TaxID=413964 RepID=A0AAW9S670_9BACT